MELKFEILKFTKTLFSEVLNDENSNKFPGYDAISAANPWFTEDNVKFMFQYWVDELNSKNVENWLNAYNFKSKNNKPKLAIIFAGNIPMVGMHDLLCGLVCNCDLKLKLSSKDKILPKWYISQLKNKFPELENSIEIIDHIIKDFDAVIATGSNNSGRYFNYYFEKYPHIIRKNRNSVALITGNENIDELEAIAEDIFIYFGLGCRSISMLLAPENYDFTSLIEIFIQKYDYLINHHKYANNYEYYRALFLMNMSEFKDCGFFILRESDSLAAPMSVVNYKYYKDLNEAESFLSMNIDELQTIVSHQNETKYILPGTAQKPKLNDYSDGIDTINFLLNL
ncbi:MAG: acyl-CoA reductase [Bacteroidales bacterium]|nr:acyl-CoA reductase [Bacteroidales bacterium]